MNPLGLFLNPLGLFLRTSIPCIRRILSAFLPAWTPWLRGPVSPRCALCNIEMMQDWQNPEKCDPTVEGDIPQCTPNTVRDRPGAVKRPCRFLM